MTSNYAISKKNELIDQLKYLISTDSAWLTPNDMHAIESKIDELNAFIDGKYKAHGC